MGTASAVESATTMETASTTMETASTAMETASTAMEPSATTVEASASVERITPAKSAATLEASEALATAEARASPEPIAAISAFTAISVASPAIETSSSVAVATAVIAPITRTAPEAVEPGSGADKNAAVKIIRSVVPIRCASVGSISVVAIGAIRRRADIGRRRPIRRHPVAKLNRNLCVRRSRRNNENTEQQSIL